MNFIALAHEALSISFTLHLLPSQPEMKVLVVNTCFKVVLLKYASMFKEP